MTASDSQNFTEVLGDELRSALHFHATTTWREDALPRVRPLTAQPEPCSPGVLLPPVQRVSHVSLHDALQMRFSTQGFGAAPVGLEQLAQVLGTALSQQDGHAYPSAGSLYVTRCYVIAARVTSLPRAIFEYLPRQHMLRRLPLDSFPELALARMLSQGTALVPGDGQAGAPVHLVLTLALPLIVERYGTRGYRFALQESGHVAQNLVLSAAAHGLSSVTLGSFLDDRAAQALRLDPSEVPVYVLPLGWPQTEPLDRMLPLCVAASDAAAAPWLQWRLYTPHPRALLQALAPSLVSMRQSGEIFGGWYLVKSDPTGLHVRLRLQPSLPELSDTIRLAAQQVIGDCEGQGLLTRWSPGHYEPEEFLFGGPHGMELVHHLFSLDTELCLAAATQPQARADLISHLWTELLLRVSGLDAFERFDIWSRVNLLRPAPEERFQAQLERMYEAALGLTRLPVLELAQRLAALLPGSSAQVEQLRQWGQDFQDAVTNGQLSRGPRQILVICLIFHWNRMLYGAGEQMFLTQLRLKVNQPH